MSLNNKISPPPNYANHSNVTIAIKSSLQFPSEVISAKFQKFYDESNQVMQIFYAVQHGNVEYLKMVPKDVWKNCLKCLDTVNNFSLLHYAVNENQKDVVAYLLTFKIDVNIMGSKNVRPIHLAAQRNLVEIVEILCKKRTLQIDAVDVKGQTALHIACRRGHSNMVETLLSYGASVNKLESDKISVLHHPARKNDLEMIKILLSYKAPLMIKSSNGQTPVMIAAIEGHIKVLNFLLEKIKAENGNVSDTLNEKDIDGNSCISFAIQNRNLEVLQICLLNGADINNKLVDGKTIFHTSAMTGFGELFELIEPRSWDINTVDRDGNTPLHYAVYNTDLNIVIQLLEIGADVNTSNRLFQTPIMVACSSLLNTDNNYEIIKILVSANSNLLIRDEKLKTVFHYLVERINIKTIKYLIRTISGEILFQLINLQDLYFKSPLHYAAKLGDIEICKVLLEAGADPKLFAENDHLAIHLATKEGNLNVVKLLLEINMETRYFRDINESSLIHFAAEEGKYEIFRFLIEVGIDCLAKDDYGRNTLMLSAKGGNIDIVEYILKNKINPNLFDQKKNTALHFAASGGHLEVIKCLCRHGARFQDNLFNLSPFDEALANSRKDVVKYFLNDDNWKKTMEYRHENGKSHIESLIKYNEEITIELLDKCITEIPSNKSDQNNEIKYWFGLLDAGPDDPSSSGQRYYALMSMVTFKKLNLLKHPLSTRLLQRKWKKFGLGFLLVDLILYILYIIAISFYIFAIPPIKNTDTVNETTGCVISANQTSSGNLDSEFVLKLNSAIYSLTLFRLGIIFIKLLTERSRFFQDQYCFSFIFCALYVFLFIKNLRNIPCLNEWTFAPMLLFQSYSYFLYFIQHLPSEGIKVFMFWRVFKTLTKVFLTFFCLFFGFGFAFYIINRDQAPFRDILDSSLKSMVMTMGEFDYVNYFITSPTKYSLAAPILIIYFVLFMPTTFFNLTIGLAVGDIDSMISEAELEFYKLRVEYVWEVETNLLKVIQRYFYDSEFIERPKEKRQK